MMMEGQKLVYTVYELAAQLGISRPSAFKAVNNGDIPAIRIGRRILIPKGVVERLMGRLVADIQPPIIVTQPVTISQRNMDTNGVKVENLADANGKALIYLIQIEPQKDPTLFKVGYTKGIIARVSSFKTLRPDATIVNLWFVHRVSWEQQLLAKLRLDEGIKNVAGELFICDSLEYIRKRIDIFIDSAIRQTVRKE